jgi:hypothetical protein
VSLGQLDAAIAGVTAGSSANSNGVATIDDPFPDPDAETLRQKFNELVNALRR